MTLTDPTTLDWGSMSKTQFKHNELAYELAHETNKKARYDLPKTASLADALAIAYAAYRINDNSYIKHTQRFSEPNNKTKFANKDLVRFYWEAKINHYQAKWHPTDFEMFSVTQEDYANAEDALKWMKRYVILGLGELDGFKADMVKELSKDQVVPSGRIAFVPEFVKRDQHESGLKKEIRVEYRNSQHLGKEKDTVEAVVKILDKRYSSQWESYNYVAVTTEGNLVSFMNKFEHAVGDRKRIKAKIKALSKNKLFGANETRLNYVKLYKV